MRIQHNVMAMNAYRNYSNNTKALSKNLERLSSGYKINRAGDDAAGLAISEKMRAQITGLEAAQKNVKDGISLVNTAEGAMQEVQDMLNRMVYLAQESANGTYDNEVDRLNLQKEMDQLNAEIDRIADSANFNGIKLLDGSLDAENASAAASGVKNITTQDFADKGVSPAFQANYITNRPPAATTQTNAVFTVKFDDINVEALTTGTNEVSVKIGDATLTVQNADATAMTGTTIAAKILTAGKTKGGAAEQTDGAAKVANAETSKWDAEATADGGAYVKINDHWYKMATGGAADEVTFTQVDYTGESGEVINPDFDVNVTKGGTGGNVTGTTNWKVQKTTQGKGVGTSHQAQVDVNIDFSTLRDGDQLIVGDKAYIFKIGENGTAAATDAVTTGTGVLVDLTSIFKTDADLADAAKQEQAMVAMTKAMGDGNSTTWSIGNGGAADGKGTLTFQSLSTYADATSATTGVQIAGKTTGDRCKMDTESNVMQQFYSTTKGSPAKVSFELDVTKIKEGDTFIVDGTTFEFTDGTYTSAKDNVAIDLSGLGIASANGISSSFQSNVADAIKTAINANVTAAGNAKYDITIDGNKITLASKDISGTTKVNEGKVAAKIETPGVITGKALTLQIGDTSDEFNQLKVSIGDIHAKALGTSELSIADQASAQAAVDKIKDAINHISSIRGTLGATSNRLDHTANNLSVMRENITDAESAIRDTDIAEEMMAYTKNNIVSLRRKNKINKRVKKPVFMRICGGMAPGCEECLAA